MLRSTPPVVKNLLIVNVLMYLLQMTFAQPNGGDFITNNFALHHWNSQYFNPFQFISYMFMHSTDTFFHLFFNMFALWMFGRVLEQVWGGKRFLIFYLVTGIGAALIHLIVTSFSLNGLESMVYQYQNSPTQDILNMIKENYGTKSLIYPGGDESSKIQYSNDLLNLYRDQPTVGASGSVFGILLAFGMLFPNTQLMLLFPPIPIKAKYFVIGYGAIELFSGLANNPGDNVAHFAHLGGMLFGYFLIKYWKKKSNNFY